ncbi:MAG: hypothetical protein AAFY38_08170 [Pseudomonadota bacterium]
MALRSTLTLCLSLLAANAVTARDVHYKLVDTGVQTHSTHGTGIEMRVELTDAPPDFFTSDALEPAMQHMCAQFAPSVVPWVKQQTGLESADFIAVRVVTGGILGRYALERYALTANGCGSAL